jgi:hypothetical protein
MNIQLPFEITPSTCTTFPAQKRQCHQYSFSVISVSTQCFNHHTLHQQVFVLLVTECIQCY